MKKLFFITFCLLTSLCTSAVPAKKGVWKMLTLADGTQIQAQLIGDEHGHCFLSQEGRTYQKVSNSDVYREINGDSLLREAAVRRNAINARRSQRLRRAASGVGAVGNYIGQRKGIVILVNFSDVTFKAANDSAFFHRMANEENFSEGRFKGSMYDYFLAQSEGQFQLTFDIFGPVTVSQPMAHYGGNDQQGNDKHPAQMVCEAVNLVKDEVPDWQQYDWDGDGWIDQVYLIYAGFGEADTDKANTIWPHAYDLYSGSSYGDGDGPVEVGERLFVNTYACGSELNGYNQIEGIGTMCHEFSHCLGYPDFYDTTYSGGQGMDVWDLMSGGSYNDDGYQPAGYTGYERWMAGWKRPIELNRGTKVIENMKGLQDGGETYIMYNDGHRQEYFMLENRTRSGWDASLPGSGLLVVHVDYNEAVWASNGPNTQLNHQRMTWVPADGDYNQKTYQGFKYIDDADLAKDVLPSGKYDAFGDDATAQGKLYNANTDGSFLLHKGVYDVRRKTDHTISFTYQGTSPVDMPVFTPRAGIYTEAQTVTITCRDKKATVYYTLDGTDPTTESTVYTEPISVSDNMTIKAIAVTDTECSYISTGEYVIRALTPSADDADYVWAEDWSSSPAGTAAEAFQNPSVLYSGDNGLYCLTYNATIAGGQAPELLIPHKNRDINALKATIALGTVSGKMSMSFKSSVTLTVNSDTPGVSVTPVSVTGKTYQYYVNVPETATPHSQGENNSMLTLTFATSTLQNARIDDILLLKPASITAVRDIRHEPSAEAPQAVYDLQGRRVGLQSDSNNQTLKKGVYIIGGKKVVVK